MSAVASAFPGLPLLRKQGAIDAGIAQYCEAARVRFEKCTDRASTRQFLLHYVEKIVHLQGEVSLHGSVPITNHEGYTTATNALAFCIETEPFCHPELQAVRPIYQAVA
jgi:hypothetical protein